MTIKLILGAALITTVAATTGVFATGEGTLNAPLQVPENPAVELPVELIYARAFELAALYDSASEPAFPQFSGILPVTTRPVRSGVLIAAGGHTEERFVIFPFATVAIVRLNFLPNFVIAWLASASSNTMAKFRTRSAKASSRNSKKIPPSM